MPLGPSVVLTMSVTAMAPTKEDCGRGRSEQGWLSRAGQRRDARGAIGLAAHHAGILALLFGRALAQDAVQDVLRSLRARWRQAGAERPLPARSSSTAPPSLRDGFKSCA